MGFRDCFGLKEINEQAIKDGRQPATCEPLLLFFTRPILGRLIPAGTGMAHYRNLEIEEGECRPGCAEGSGACPPSPRR